jgi:hypothetical protein
MREKLLTTFSLIITAIIMAGLMVMAVDALDLEAQALEQRTAEHVARMQ